MVVANNEINATKNAGKNDLDVVVVAVFVVVDLLLHLNTCLI